MPRIRFHLSNGERFDHEVEDDVDAVFKAITHRHVPYNDPFTRIGDRLVRTDAIIQVTVHGDSTVGFG